MYRIILENQIFRKEKHFSLPQTSKKNIPGKSDSGGVSTEF